MGGSYIVSTRREVRMQMIEEMIVVVILISLSHCVIFRFGSSLDVGIFINN
jgi:hypothetical protein